MTTAYVFAAVAGAWIAAFAVWRASGARASTTDAVRLRIRFDRSITMTDVAAFIAALTGLRPPWWKRLWRPVVVVFEVRSTGSGLEHGLIVQRTLLPRVTAALRTHLRSVRFEQFDDDVPGCTDAVEYRLTDPRRELRVEETTSRRQLAAVSSAAGTAPVVQWIISPGSPPVVPRQAEPTARSFGRGVQGGLRNAVDVAAAREKLSSPVFGATLRIGVTATETGAARAALRELEAPLHATAAPGTHLRRRWMTKRRVARRLNRRTVPLHWPIAMNSGELAGLLAWPLNGFSVRGLDVAASLHLPVSDAIAETGTIVGDGVAHGRVRTAALGLDGRRRHLTLLGATGSGKTTLMIDMAVVDITAGRGVLVLDPKGVDLVDGVLERLAPEQHERVVVLDAADHDRPVGVNPLRQSGVHPELAVEHLVSTLRRVWSQSWGLRTDDLARMALRSIITDPDATLVDVVPVLTDAAFRRRLLGCVTDPELLRFWQQFGALSDGEAAQWTAPLANKLRAVTARPSLRRILGQPHPPLDIAAHLNGGGVLVVPLNGGQVGDDAASLFGALILGQLWSALQLRTDTAGRVPLMLYLDEVGRYAHTPVPLDELLSQARSFDVGVTMSLQHLGQLSPELRHTVLANPRSRVVFQVGATDGRVMANEFGQGLSAEHFVGLEPFEVYAQLFAHGRTQPAATLTTRPPTPTVGTAAEVRRLSRERWGVDGHEVDAALAARHAPPAKHRDGVSDVPTGRKRRST